MTDTTAHGANDPDVTGGDGPVPLQSGPVSAPEEADGPVRTGVPAVDAVLTQLGELDTLPVSEHADHYERMHAELHEALAGIDDAGREDGDDEPATTRS
ncbi:MAG: hypothetical protein K6T37_01020 [Acidothermus cellulolyticus]|nr:hypothetical protein [Acidothermus cellulolyticus]